MNFECKNVEQGSETVMVCTEQPIDFGWGEVITIGLVSTLIIGVFMIFLWMILDS